MPDILALVSADGVELKWVASTHGGEYAGPCPACGGKDRFRAWPSRDDGKKQVWMCRGCDKGGDEIEYLRHVRGMSFAEAKQALGLETAGGTIRPAFKKQDHKTPQEAQVKKIHQALLDSQEVLDYLAGRGITRESAVRFRLGLRRRNGTAWLAIPHFVGDKAVNVKFRSLPPAEKAFERVSGCRSVLFNAGAIRGRKEIIVTEGEIDAITLVQAGFKNVVGRQTARRALTRSGSTISKRRRKSSPATTLTNPAKRGSGTWPGGWATTAVTMWSFLKART